MLSENDRRRLADLSHRYAVGVDDRRYADVGALFGTSGVLEPAPGTTRVGAEAIEQALANLDRYDRTFHLLGQISIDEADGQVTGETYCIAHHFRADPASGGTADHVMYIRYHDRFEFERGWRFARRRLDVTWAGAEDKADC